MVAVWWQVWVSLAMGVLQFCVSCLEAAGWQLWESGVGECVLWVAVVVLVVRSGWSGWG